MLKISRRKQHWKNQENVRYPNKGEGIENLQAG